MSEPIWKLKHADELIGEIRITDGDFPWLSGTFVPLPGFARFKPLFEQELQLLDAVSDPDSDTGKATDAWEAAYALLSSSLTMINDHDVPVAEFLLHIQDTQAWFRWSDDPFDE
jgi:hypothetical protein